MTWIEFKLWNCKLFLFSAQVENILIIVATLVLVDNAFKQNIKIV